MALMLATILSACGDDSTSTFDNDSGDDAADGQPQTSDACVICSFDAGKDAATSD